VRLQQLGIGGVALVVGVVPLVGVGGGVTAEDRSAQRSDPLTGKPRTTQVLRAFAPIAGRDLRTLRQALIERAGRTCWAVSTVADGSTRGSITLLFGVADLVIAVNRYTTPPTITVTLAPANPNL